MAHAAVAITMSAHLAEWCGSMGFDGTFDGTFDRAFDRTFDRTFDETCPQTLPKGAGLCRWPHDVPAPGITVSPCTIRSNIRWST